MKIFLLSIVFLTATLFNANAQCVVMSSCTPDPNLGYCVTPPINAALPIGAVGLPYSTSIQVSIGTTAGGGLVAISSASILSISGLPGGLTSSTNPGSGTIPGGASGCVLISGTPTVFGTFTLAASVVAQTSFGLQTNVVNWTLVIGVTIGLPSLTSVTGVLYLVPNPAKNELNVSSDSNIGIISIYDALGKVVLTAPAPELSNISLNISSLPNGVYFLQAHNGAKTTYKKFIKD